jgi:hypothetical protein
MLRTAGDGRQWRNMHATLFDLTGTYIAPYTAVRLVLARKLEPRVL